MYVIVVLMLALNTFISVIYSYSQKYVDLHIFQRNQRHNKKDMEFHNPAHNTKLQDLLQNVHDLGLTTEGLEERLKVFSNKVNLLFGAPLWS